jgi:ribosomal protein S11
VDHSKIFYLLYIIITKNNLKISITNLKGEVVFKKSQGMLKGIRRGSINSADASLIMMNQISDDLRGFNIKYLGIYLKGATR